MKIKKRPQVVRKENKDKDEFQFHCSKLEERLLRLATILLLAIALWKIVSSEFQHLNLGVPHENGKDHFIQGG